MCGRVKNEKVKTKKKRKLQKVIDKRGKLRERKREDDRKVEAAGIN